MTAFDDLQRNVAGEKSVSASGPVLIRGIAQMVREAAFDPAQVNALAGNLDEHADYLTEGLVMGSQFSSAAEPVQPRYFEEPRADPAIHAGIRENSVQNGGSGHTEVPSPHSATIEAPNPAIVRDAQGRTVEVETGAPNPEITAARNMGGSTNPLTTQPTPAQQFVQPQPDPTVRVQETSNPAIGSDGRTVEAGTGRIVNAPNPAPKPTPKA